MAIKHESMPEVDYYAVMMSPGRWKRCRAGELLPHLYTDPGAAEAGCQREADRRGEVLIWNPDAAPEGLGK